jgi:hypothetical protein
VWIIHLHEHTRPRELMLTVLHGQLRTKVRAQDGDQGDSDELLGVVRGTIHGVPPLGSLDAGVPRPEPHPISLG